MWKCALVRISWPKRKHRPSCCRMENSKNMVVEGWRVFALSVFESAEAKRGRREGDGAKKKTIATICDKLHATLST